MELTYNFFGHEINLLRLQVIGKPFYKYTQNDSCIILPLLFTETNAFTPVNVPIQRGEAGAWDNDGNNSCPLLINGHPSWGSNKDQYWLGELKASERIQPEIDNLKKCWQEALKESIK